MRPCLATAAILFFAEQASLAQSLQHILPPSNIIDVSKVFGHSNSMEGKVRRDAHVMIRHALHQRNAIPSPSSGSITQIIPDPPSLEAASGEDTWSTNTEAACLKILGAVKSTAANPCGMTACYNIKFLNTTTGAFQTDLRLYRTSPATGDWTSADSKSFSIGITCDGAPMAAGNTKLGKRDDDLLSWPPIRRYAKANSHPKRAATPLKLLQQITFYGQVKEDLMGNISDGAKVRSYLAPKITISGKDKNGESLTADLSTNNTSFITGTLANQVASLPASASGPVLTSTSSTATSAPAKVTAFVLPGKTLGIFPVGLIITSVWALLFLGTVGLGTVDRIRFREAYRRRMKREMGRDVVRI